MDEEFARPLIAEFQKQTGITVHAQFDTEAGKTTGLVERLRAERQRPRADVFWSSEIFGTIELANAGVLAPAAPDAAVGIPFEFRDPQGRWTAFGLRGRVLAYDPKRIWGNDVPKRWADLSNLRYKGRIAMANPQFGTTRGHMAALLLAWGEPAFTQWLKGLAENGVRLADGNAQAIKMVTLGQIDFGFTDTDDVNAATRRGELVHMATPDMDTPGGEKIPGTLWIPNTVGRVARGPNPDASKQLIEFIASPLVEQRLAESESGNLPVRADLREKLGMPAPPMAKLDYAAAAGVMARSDELTREILVR